MPTSPPSARRKPDKVSPGILPEGSGPAMGWTPDTGPNHNDPKEIIMARSEEHTSELQSLMRISYAVFCLKKKTQEHKTHTKYYYTNQTTNPHQQLPRQSTR